MNKLFSFIIISYNRPDDTIEAVRNVLQLDEVDGYTKEIIILNNGSSTSYTTFEAYLNTLPSKCHKNLHYINHTMNLGVAGGRNLCIKMAKGEYMFFLDDDAEIMQKNSMALILDKFNKYEKDNLKIIGCMGKNPFTGKEDIPLKDPKLMEGKKDIFYSIFFGYGHAFPKGLMEEVGFYQEDFFYGMEEYDLAYSAIKKGYTILFTKDILVLHKFNPSGREPSNLTYARMFENKTLVAYKHLPWIYVLTHFILWSGFFLLKSKLDILLYFSTIKSLRKRMRVATREVMNKNGMDYLRKVGARVTY